MLKNIVNDLKEEGISYLKVRIIPKSNENKIVEFMNDGTLKIRIAAIPEKGKANKELIKFLKKELKKIEYPSISISILNGKSDRNKLIKITE